MTKPTKLKDCTIADYTRFEELAVIHDKSESPIKDYEMVEAFFEDDFKDMDEATMSAFFNDWVGDMTDTEPIEKSLHEGKTGWTPPQTITVAGQKFKIPRNVENQSMGQYADYQSYLGRIKSAAPETAFYPIALAIFLRKPKERYSQIKLNDRIETMKKCNVITACKLCAFFLVNSKRFRDITSHLFQQSPASQKTK